MKHNGRARHGESNAPPPPPRRYGCAETAFAMRLHPSCYSYCPKSGRYVYSKVNMPISRSLKIQHPARVTSLSFNYISVSMTCWVSEWKTTWPLNILSAVGRLTYFTDLQGKINRFEKTERAGIKRVELHFQAHYTFALNVIPCNPCILRLPY
jgi:hypothetical protein